MAGRDGSLTTMISPLEETRVQNARVRARLGDRTETRLPERSGRAAGSVRTGSRGCWAGARWRASTRPDTWTWIGIARSRSWTARWSLRQPGIREQFQAEARAVANLLHPHIVTIYNLGSADGHHFIEMEYVPGGRTLRDMLVHEGPLDPARAVPLARQVVLALGAAHDSGLVHRDIKPANVLLTRQGEAKLADFGLVRRLDELAQGGAPLAGTPTFMAPELFQGTPASTSSDIYAVGVLLFHCLSGRLPVVADSVGQLIQLHRTQAGPRYPRDRPEVPGRARRDPAAVPGQVARATAIALARRAGRGARRTSSAASATSRAWSRESVEGLDCFIQGCRDTFRLIVPLPDDRLQEVIVEASEGANHGPVLTVFSVCGPADPDVLPVCPEAQLAAHLRQHLGA